MIAFALARASSAAFLKRRVTTDVRDFFFFERFEVSMRVLFSPGVCVCVGIYIYDGRSMRSEDGAYCD